MAKLNRSNLVPWGEPGGGGYVSDMLPTELPPGVASDIQNVRFIDGAVVASPQSLAIYDVTGSNVPEGICSFQSGRGYGRQLIVPESGGNIYMYGTDDGTQKTVYTGAAIVGASGVRKWSWHTGPAMVIAMHRDQEPLILLDPESWWYDTPGSPTFALLPWDVTAASTWADEDVRATFFRDFEGQLLAFNLIEGGAEYQTRVRWSSLYAPGAAPETWDESRTDHLAGYYDISDAEGAIWDAQRLGNMMLLYKADGVWAIMRTGGEDVFSFDPLPIDVRALIQDCVVPFRGKHFVLTRDNVVVHDGVNVDYIANGQVRGRIFGDLNNDYLNRIYCFHVPIRNEIWVCYPTGTSPSANEAMCWNYETGRWGHRYLPSARQLCLFRPEENGQDFNFFRWAEYPAAASADGNVYELDTDTDVNGVAPACYWERRGISLTDPNEHSFIRRLVIKMRNRVPVTVKVGHHNDLDGAITWDATKTYDPNPNGNSDIEITARVGGRYLALRVESEASASYAALATNDAASALWSMYTPIWFEHEDTGDRGRT